MNRIFRNSLINILQVAVVTPVFFLLIPYTISKIGKDGYGLFALVGVMASYQVFVEMGFANTLVRFVAQSMASNRPGLVSEYLSTTLTFFLAVTVIFYLVIHLLAPVIADLIPGIREDRRLVTELLRIAAISALINVVSGLFKSVLDGIQRMDISNLIVMVQVILSAIGTVVMLELGFGIRGLFLNALFFSVVSLVANILVSRKMVKYRLRLSFSRQRFREMFSYSVHLQLSSLLFFWIDPVNKILITWFLPISYVGYYDIAVKISGRITSLIRSGLASIFPAATEKHEQSGSEGIDMLRIKSLKYLYPLVSILYVIGFVITPAFVILWLGKDLQVTVWAILIMLIGSFFSILATPAYILLMGAGFSKDNLKVQVQTSIANIAGIAVFAGLFGFYGFCIGYAVSMIYGFFATHWIYQRRFRIPDNAFRIFLDRKVIASGCVVAASGIIFSFIVDLRSWITLLLAVLVMSAMALVSVWKMKVLTCQDILALTGKPEKFHFFFLSGKQR